MGEHGLMRDAMVYLAAAIVFVPLAARLRLGSVLGYLVAGCVIGPFGLGLVRDVHSILHFAEFGVVLMLFLIGLELDARRLWQMRRAVFGGGSLQMAASGVALVGLALGFGLPWQAAMVAGLAIALSSTAIAIQTMRERSLLEAPLGKSAFAVLLFQDIAAIPLIAVVPLLAGGAGGSLIGVARGLGAIVAVVVIGRYLVQPVLRVIAKTGLREVFTGFALFLVVAIAQIMTYAGLSMALGAFLAGVLLASSEYRHALETDIEPFKGLLMGLFFIAVGMSIDFGLLRERAVLVTLLVVGLVALKTLSLGLIAPRLNVPKKQRWLFAALLSQGGEFAFVVFGVAGQAHLLPEPWDALLTLAVALSMAATPLLVVLHDWLLVRDERESRPAEPIETDAAPVIIAGFGRFGQIIGRLLFAHGVQATLLDRDPDQIEFIKKFGFRVFFGDAARLDLLTSARAAEAKLLVVAIDDVAASLRLVDIAREHFPHLTIVARARNVGHYLQLRSRGIEYIERETFEASLRAGRKALEVLGESPFEMKEVADRFRLHNTRTLDQLVPLLADEAQRMSLARAARDQLEAQFARDREARARTHGAWVDDADREPAPPAPEDDEEQAATG
ncbi:MAG: potassium efflux system protein [Labilithrix sp.]|nr:potassium efflux system protein [Labilithrix sp.]